MKKGIQFVLLLLVVALVSAGSSYLMRCCMTRNGCSHCASVREGTDAHRWIHEQLGLSADQERQLEPMEQRYHAETQHLQEVIRLANMELGQALLEDREVTDRVRNAIQRVHDAQGQLQQKAIEHVVEMKSVLTAEQYQKLLNLTADALYQIDR
mgnify:CR=1 FL=1